jgi:hypothetical protein
VVSGTLCYIKKPLGPGQFKEAVEKAIAHVVGPDAKIKVAHYPDSGNLGLTEELKLDIDSLGQYSDLPDYSLTLKPGRKLKIGRYLLTLEFTALITLINF